MRDKKKSVLKEKEKHCQDEWQVLPPSYDCGGHNAFGCRSVLKGHTQLQLSGKSLSLSLISLIHSSPDLKNGDVTCFCSPGLHAL